MRSDFFADLTVSLCALRFLKNVNKMAISNHTALKLRIQALKSYSKVSCEYELYILPNTKLNILISLYLAKYKT